MSEKKHKNEDGGTAENKAAAPGDAAGKTAADVQEVLSPEPVAKQEGEVAVLKDRLLRLQADFDNFRKRIQREKAEWSVTANESMVGEVIAVLDNFERGLKTAADHKTDKAVQDGFQMVYDQMLAALKKFGATPLDVHESGFDPKHHEAVAHVPSDEYPADEIVAQTRRGWKLGEKLLRPVQVVISAGPGAPRDDEVKPAADEPKASE